MRVQSHISVPFGCTYSDQFFVLSLPKEFEAGSSALGMGSKALFVSTDKVVLNLCIVPGFEA